MTTGKEHGINISASVIVSWITIGAFMWLFAKPLLVNSVSAALADEIKQTVANEIAPLNGAFVALLQRDMNTTKKEIAALKFRQRSEQDWRVADAKELVEKEIELEALKAAKEALQNTS